MPRSHIRLFIDWRTLMIILTILCNILDIVLNFVVIGFKYQWEEEFYIHFVSYLITTLLSGLVLAYDKFTKIVFRHPENRVTPILEEYISIVLQTTLKTNKWNIWLTPQWNYINSVFQSPKAGLILFPYVEEKKHFLYFIQHC